MLAFSEVDEDAPWGPKGDSSNLLKKLEGRDELAAEVEPTRAPKQCPIG